MATQADGKTPNLSKEEQHAKEEKGAARIFGMLPKEKGRKLYDLWQEFEAGETAEARFAHTMDNIQPMMLPISTSEYPPTVRFFIPTIAP